MPLQCFSGSDKHDCRRRETGGAAFDVHEFFSAQVTAETGFRDSPVAQRHRCLSGYDRVASMGDIGKGAAVNKGEIASSVCTRLGFMASKSRAIKAPVAPKSLQV